MLFILVERRVSRSRRLENYGGIRPCESQKAARPPLGSTGPGVWGPTYGHDLGETSWRGLKRSRRTVLRYVAIVCICVVVLFPLYWMVLSTFQPEVYTLTFPPPLFLKGFNSSAISVLFQEFPIAASIGHSILVGVVTVTATIFFAVPGAYLLSRLRWRGVAPRLLSAVHPADAGRHDRRTGAGPVP